MPVMSSNPPMTRGTARLIRSRALKCVGLPLLVLVLAVSVLVSPVTCKQRICIPLQLMACEVCC